MRIKGTYFTFSIDNTPDLSVDVTRFHLKEALSKCFTLTINLSTAFPLSDKMIDDCIPSKCHFKIYVNGQCQRTVSGVVMSVTQDAQGQHHSSYIFVVRSILHLASFRQDSQIFCDKSAIAVMQEIFDTQQLLYTEFRLSDEHSERDYITQRRETDLDFIQRLAAEEGLFYWLDSKSDAEQCVFADYYSALSDGGVLTYNSHPQKPSEGRYISKLNLTYCATPRKYIGKDRNFNSPDYPFLHEQEYNPHNKKSELHTIFDSYGRMSKDSAGKAFARYRLERILLERKTGVAHSNDIGVMPGKTFQIIGHPNPSMNLAIQPIAVEHIGTQPQALEQLADPNEGATLTNTITFIPADKTYRPPFITKPFAEGPEVATVMGAEGNEIFTNEIGQILVNFHWDRVHDKHNTGSSCWMRVSQSWAGPGYGFYALPRIGQEVIVTYLDGDYDRPIVTGCVYNGNNLAPIDFPNDKTQTVIRTKSHFSEGFNELRFEDAEKKERIFIHASKNMDTEVCHNRTTKVDNDHSENVGNNQRISVGTKSTLHIGTDEKSGVIQSAMSLDNKGNIEIAAETSITLKVGENTIVINKDGSITVKATNLVDIDGDTLVDIDGGEVQIK